MLVVVVDESAKKSRVRSRRVLSKYLPQIASATWMGNLSSEGIGQLHEEIKGKGSKTTSVCCFVVRSTKRTELLWRVGSTTEWTDAGWFAYRDRNVFQTAK